MFGLKTLIIFLLVVFIFVYVPVYFLFHRKYTGTISLLISVIPASIVCGVIVFVGNLFWNNDAKYIPVGDYEEYDLYQVSLYTDLKKYLKPTDKDTCFTYLERNTIEEHDHDHDGDSEEDGVDFHRGTDSHGSLDSTDVKDIMVGDLCLGRNLVSMITGEGEAFVRVYKAKPDPDNFFSLFSFERAPNYYVISTP